MRKINRRLFVKVLGFAALCLLGGATLIHSKTQKSRPAAPEVRVPIILTHLGSSPALERPAVSFDHDLHTKELKSTKPEDCGVCHVLKQRDTRLVNPDVKVFIFPKAHVDFTSKTAIMYAYHDACVSCHRKTRAQGRKAGPDIALCGSCHVRRPYIRKTTWSWEPIFNYSRHAKHVKAIRPLDQPQEWNVAQKVNVIGKITDADKTCEVCHHVYSAEQKRLIFQKNTENSCRACHKAKDEKNARSMVKVAHAGCISCHMKAAEKVRSEMTRAGRTKLTEQDKKKFGPIDCQGCHGVHKELTPEEIGKIPRLVRGQKDMIDLPVKIAKETPSQTAAAAPSPVAKETGMKMVAFNHKTHEIQGQFCSTCHHHSIQKCRDCHTVQGNLQKGGGITYQQAFHDAMGKRSCVGCHFIAKQDKKCAGCHQQLTAQLPQSSCGVCHSGPSGGVSKEVAPVPLATDKNKVPEKVQMKSLVKEYKPAEMPHMKIVNRMITISNKSTLARRFHSVSPDTLCQGCHHNTQPSAQVKEKWPSCASCHGDSPFTQAVLGRPYLLNAYHQQCMQCHQTIGQKPTPLECVKCHALKSPLQIMTRNDIPLRGYGK